MPQTQRTRWLFVALGAAVAIVVAAYMIFGGGAGAVGQSKFINAKNKPIGHGVTVTGKVPRKIRADLASSATPPPFKATSASPVLEIGPSGNLPGKATITMPLNRQATGNDLPLVAANFTHQLNGWVLVPTTLLPDGRHVQFQTDHLSWWEPLWFDLKGALGELKTQFFDGMTSGAFAHAEKPKCDNEDQAREDLYDITSDAKNTVYWCFGIEKSARVLKVVNRKNYPIELKLHDLKVKSTSGENLFDFERLAGIGHTILSSGQEATFTVSLPKKGGKATLDTDLSKMALGLKALDVLADAAVTLLLHANIHSATKTLELVKKLLYDKGCLGVLGTFNIGDLIKECFDKDLLTNNFGWQSAFLAPVMFAFSVFDLSRAVYSVYDDHKNGTAKYHIEITRSTPAAILASFAGKWAVHGMWMKINRDGSATEWWNDGPCYDIVNDPNAPPTMCAGNARIQFTPNSDRTITGTVTSVWSTTWDGAKAPPEFKPTDLLHRGDSIQLSHQDDPHLLWVTYPGSSGDMGNRNLCDDYAYSQNDGEHYGSKCGA